MSAQDDQWKGLLDANETIVWQGHPDSALRFDLSQPMQTLMGVFFVGFSVFWMSTAAMAGGFFWMFGLLFFGVGLFNAIGVHFWKSYLRRNTHYTLTSKRAFIASKTPWKRKLQSYPITPDTTLSLVEHGRYSTIHFAEETSRGQSGIMTTNIGFEYIPAARDVIVHMRAVQQGSA